MNRTIRLPACTSFKQYAEGSHYRDCQSAIAIDIALRKTACVNGSAEPNDRGTHGRPVYPKDGLPSPGSAFVREDLQE